MKITRLHLLSISIVLFLMATHLYGQGTITIGPGSSISVGTGSSVTAGYRDGTMLSDGTFNARSIVLDPVATAATSITQTSFFSNWNASPGANGYKLDVSTASNFATFVTGYQNLDVGNVTTYSVSGLTAGTTYYYRLRAYDIDGITGYSNTITLITAPAPPVASSATNINESSFRANWAASASATKYFIDVATDAGFTAPVAGWTNVDMGNVTSYNVTTNLTANTTYYYRIRAANAYAASNNSNSITVLTAPIPPVAAAATSLAQTSFDANWNAPAGATKYYLDVSTINTFATYVSGYQNLDVGNAVTYSVNTNLTAGTTYYYRVRSSNGDGVSTNSNTISALTVPPTPVATAATAVTQTSFSANWDASVSATKYYIDVATDAAFTAPVAAWTDVDMGNVLTYSVNTNLTAGTTYYYRIRSYNASGTSGNSNVINTTTRPPNPVTTAATSISETGFTANWDASLSATKYFLDVSTSNTFSSFVTGWSNVDVGNVITYSVGTNITAGTTYYYRVRASNTNGASGNSNVTSLTTIPPQPVTIAATSVSTTNFNANWNAASGAAGYYLDVATDAGFTSMVTGWTNVDVNNVTTYLVNTNLTAGTTYYYRVRAYNSGGTSVSSAGTSVLTAPVAPVAAASSGSGASNFNANWNITAGATGYYLDVAKTNTFDAGTFVGGFDGLDVTNVLTYDVNINLTAGTTYYYRVRAYNAGGASGNSNTITTATAAANPIAAAASSITSTSFNANWNSVTGASGYRLDVSDASDFSTFLAGFQDVDVANVLTYNIPGLSSNTTYYYRVRAYNTYGTSGNSGTITTLTSPGASVSTAATSIAAANFTANWNATAGATGYFLDVSTVNNFASFVSGFEGIDVGAVTSYLVSGLSSGTTYYYRVRAYNAGGTGANSGNQTVLTLPPPPVATAASAITGTGFTANWNPAASATGYRLDVSTDPAFGGGFVGVYNDFDAANVTTKAIAGLTEGTTYYYRLRTYNGTGTGGNSNIITITVVPPSPVEQAATSITNNSFEANWLASTGATGYKLDVSTVSNFASFVAGYNDLDVGNVLIYTATALSAGTPYYYRVRAYNSAGTSASSGTINPSTAGIAPRAPAANPATAIAATSFSANWVASSGATGYKLDVSTASDFSSYVATWQDVDVAALTKSVNVNITAGTQYYYRVRALNADGTSGNSSTISVLTIPAAPVEQDATNITFSSFDANWTASTGATGYYLDVATDAGFTSLVPGYNNLDVSNTTTYTVTGLLGSTPYYYRIRAYNTGGTSGDSGSKNPTTSDPTGTITAAPATAVTGTSFSANWAAYGGATGYLLDVSTVSNFASFVTGYNNLDVGNVITYSVNTNLSAGTNYYYRIIAQGVVASSGTINVLTLPAPPTTNAATANGETSFTANWNPSTGATGYYIDVATDAGLTSFVTGFNNKYVNNVTSYSITGLTAGTQYYYQVRGKNGSGTSGNSDAASTYTTPKEPVSSAAANILTASFDAKWSAAAGATTYYIDVATDDTFLNILADWNNTDVGNVTTKNINTGLTAGTIYYYRVRSSNAGGLSASYSSMISLTTAPEPPVADNATAIDKTTFTANWTASTGATKYFLDVATTSSFDGGTFVSGYQNLDVGNVVSYAVSGLSRGTTYYYRLRAYNSNGTSIDSGTKSALTLPADPNALSATDILSTSFSANWGSSTGASSYKLSVSTDPAFGGGFVGGYNNFDVGNVTTKSITGLTAGTTYYYRVKAVNATGDSDASGVITVTTSPSAPNATAATSLEETSISANWDASAGADGYLLDVSTLNNFASFVAGFNGKDVHNVTTYPVTGLTGGSTYYYRIRAYTGSRPSDNSGTITFLTKPVAVVSAAASAVETTGFTANWNTTTSATGYKLEVSTNSGFTSYVATYGPKDVGNVITYPISGLTANTNYYYRVSAYNASGTGIVSNYQSVLTAPLTPNPTAATSITNITIKANWDAVAGATGYRLDVSTDPTFAGGFVLNFNDKDVSNVNTYTVTGLNGSTTYYYRVRAYNTGGTSASSGNITAVTAPDPSPAPVATAATSLAQTSFSANWNPAATATGYRLDVATDIAFTTFVAGYEDIDVANVTTYSVTGLTAGTTYYFRTRSYNGTGTSSNSNTITVLTVPANPTSTAATSVEETGFTANWNASAGATKYYIDVSTDPAFGTFVGAYNNFDAGNVTTLSISPLLGGTTYYYRVRANNASGSSGNSDNINALTKPAAPAASAATSVTQTSFSANWAASTGASTYYLDISTDPAFGSFIAGYNNKDVTNVTTYSVTGLTANTTYYYRVRGNNATGTSSNSATIAIIGIPTVSAAAPVNESGFSANWTAVTGATKYFVDVSTASDISSFLAGYNNTDVGDVVTVSVPGLTANTTYYYRVRAFNADGTSDNSASITVLTAPAIPVSSSATSSTPAGFSANWNSSVGATGYYLDVATDNAFTHFLEGYNNRDVSNVVTYSVTGIERGTTYYYRVRAYNTGAASGNSAVISILAAPLTEPATDIMQTSFSANWNSVSGAIKYYLDVSTDAAFGAGTFIAGFQDKDVGNVITFSVAGLTKNTDYYYRVRAYDGTITSGNSDMISTRTLPDAPIATAATGITQTSFYANWNIPGGSAPGYKIDVATDIAFTNFVSGCEDLSTGAVTTYLITGLTTGVANQSTGLTPGTTYYYRVRAINSWGATNNSNIITVLTAPQNPVAIDATDITTISFTAAWNVTAGLGYKIDVASDTAFTTLIRNNVDMGSASSLLVDGLSPNTKYFYRVRAYNASGASNNSNVITAITLAEKPILANIETSVLNYNIKQSELNLTGTISATSTTSSPIQKAEIYVSKNYLMNEDQLLFTDMPGIIGLWDANNGRLTLQGNAPAENYQAAIRTICYRNNSITPAVFEKEITIIINNGFFDSNPVSREIAIKQGNDTPTLNNLENDKLIYLKGVSPLRILLSETITAEDTDNAHLFSAEIKFSSGYIKGEDYFDCNNTSFITGLFNKETGILTITGKATVLGYQNFLREVTYRNSSQANGTSSLKAVEFTINDGLINCTPVLRELQVKAPLETPGNLQGSITSNSVALRWTDTNQGEHGYIIERSEDNNLVYIELARTDSNAVNYTDSAIKNGKKYYYRVAAYKDSLKSDCSNEIFVIGIVVGISDQNGIPENYVISQNYPNPFNPATTIIFGLPNESRVNIAIYNSIGQCVEELINETKAPGYYKVNWNGAGLASGVYIYRISAISVEDNKQFTDVKRMVLVK